MNKVKVVDLGFRPYRDTWDLQKKIQKGQIDIKIAARTGKLYKPGQGDTLLFVEHPHVYTLGKSGDSAHLLKAVEELPGIDAEYIEIDRGGDITYHGPGQIVGYPILDLDRYFTDIHKYLRYLEEVIILTCREYGLEASRIDGLTGVWVENKKICAMGIKCSRWVTMHGFAFNINTDLSYFNYIIPCGIQNKAVTSLSKLLGRKIEESEVKKYIVRHFSEVFSVKTEEGVIYSEEGGQNSYLHLLNE
ncbi:MAG: lipoyl(octanoyl) transferase LipB [Balneolaceae bacterium]